MLDLKQFPKTAILKDNRSVVIRPLEPADEGRLMQFMRSLPPVDRAGFRDEITEPTVAVQTQLENIITASYYTGTEGSADFNARKAFFLAKDEVWTVDKVLSKMRRAKGKPLTQEEVERAKKAVEELHRLEKEVRQLTRKSVFAAYEKEVKEWQSKNLKSKLVREALKEKRDQLEREWEKKYAGQFNIEKWTHQIDYSRVIPLVAVSGDEIVADWTLHRSQLLWTRHQVHIRGAVLLDWRRVGLMRMMVNELVEIAKQLEMEQVVVELFEEQRAQRHSCESLGFTTEAVLKDWVKDASGRNHTLIILSLRLEPAWREMEQLIADYGTHGG